MAVLTRAGVLLCLLALTGFGRSRESGISRMDRLKTFAPSASYPKHLRKEFIGGFRRKPLLSNVDVFFFASEKKGDPRLPLQINNVVMPRTACFNQSSAFECHAPVTYVRHVFKNPDTFLVNTSLSAFVRQLICRRLVFDVLSADDLNESIKMFDLHLFCPNPCRDGSKRPCSARKAISDQCLRSHTLIYDNSFTCRCDKYMVWSITFEKCVPDFRNLKRHSRLYCAPGNTRMREKMEFSDKCVCKEGFTGLNCNQIVDSCSSRFGGYYSQLQFKGKFKGGLSGRAACRALGTANLCVPYKPTITILTTFGIRPWVAYSCVCERPFLPDPELPFPNCLARESACDVLACAHGRCTSAGSTATCACEPGWFGPLCDSAEQEEPFLEWSAWSLCLPLCGAQRFRFRERRCLVASCKEQRRQTRPCRPRSCFRYFLLDRLLDAMKVRDKATDILYDFGFLIVWFFCATILVAAAYAILLLTGPFLDRVAHTQRVASFLTWWKAKREGMISQLDTVRRGRK